MGNCENVALAHLQFVREENHTVFGLVKIMKNNKKPTDNLVALKKITFPSEQALADFGKNTELTKQYYELVPTLLRLQGFEINQEPTCSPYSATLKFEYFADNLADRLAFKKQAISKAVNTNRKRVAENLGLSLNESGTQQQILDIQRLNRVRLNDYDSIDRLSQRERKYIGLFFLESEILQMLDHVIGAAYYLNYLRLEHCAIRPNTILIDEQGKYILVDRQILCVPTNYQIATSSKPARVPYMSPQEFKAAKTRQITPQRDPGLTDIFSIGMMALEMASLESLEGIYDFNLWRINLSELNRLLSQIKYRYSSELVILLQRMLSLDESERIYFDQLIISLDPLMNRDIEEMERVYGPLCADGLLVLQKHYPITRYESFTLCPANTHSLVKRLSDLEEGYQRVMSNKLLDSLDQSQSEKWILDRLRQQKLVCPLPEPKRLAKEGASLVSQHSQMQTPHVSSIKKNPVPHVYVSPPGSVGRPVKLSRFSPNYPGP